jgi:NAD(P)-dependent dehydrogenase (short-subunit alcohol dehydrogenase family)
MLGFRGPAQPSPTLGDALATSISECGVLGATRTRPLRSMWVVGRRRHRSTSLAGDEFTSGFGGTADVTGIVAGSDRSRMTQLRHWRAARLVEEPSLPSCRRGTTVDEHRPHTIGVRPRRECTEERKRMKDLAGRTAFVTGAASGIGLGIATALSQAGVKVMLCDIEEEALAKAISGFKLTNADVDGVRADVSLKAELQAAADATVARYGRVHFLVNNAGVGGGGGYGRWTDASWNWVLGVNLMSVIWGIEIFGPLIEAHGEGGQIVSTASIAGLIPGSALPYNVTKYGVVALSEGLRATLAPRGIGVSVLCPGFIRTEIMNSRRNLPERFAGAVEALPTEGPIAEFVKEFQERVSKGIDPLYVGELVREGIENDWPYIFTDTEFEPLIDDRFAAIKQGFDRIRRRQPRH